MSVESLFERFPNIEVNKDFYLRQHQHEDAESYLAYMTDEDVIRFVPEECIPRSIERAKHEIDYHRDLFRYRRSLYWALARRDNNQIVGCCGFNYWSRDHSRGEISYDLARKYWNKGVMSATVKSVVAFAFTQMKMVRIEATIHPENIASLRILNKLGFQKEGLLRDHKKLHGKFYDAQMLSLLQREFFPF
jgi:ribosomal-protein-alanine N-acetyltransferase